MSSIRLHQTVAQLRSAFDETFARAVEVDHGPREALLIVRTHGRLLAVRAREIASVQRCPPLTFAPSAHPALCGLAGVRSAVVAVYQLSVLLGDAPLDLEIKPGTKRWIVLCAADRTVALLFDEVVRHVHVRPEDIHDGAASVRGEITRARVWLGEQDCGVLSVPVLLESVDR